MNSTALLQSWLEKGLSMFIIEKINMMSGLNVVMFLILYYCLDL